MRCYCCNRRLSNYESRLRHPETKEFTDMCTKCLEDMPYEPLAPRHKCEEDVMEESEYFVEENEE